MLRKSNLSKSVIVGLLVLACVLTVLLSTRTVPGGSRKAPQGQSREGLARRSFTGEQALQVLFP